MSVPISQIKGIVNDISMIVSAVFITKGRVWIDGENRHILYFRMVNGRVANYLKTHIPSLIGKVKHK